MINMLKSDLYKLVFRKAFYICGLIAGGLGVFLVILLNNVIGDLSDYGYNGINSITMGLGQVTLLASIFISMFVTSEFSYGTIKNICARGVDRYKVYLSKLMISVFTTVAYSVFASICGFIAGSIMWGVGEFKQDEFLQILKLFGLFLLAEICLQSVFVMVSFLVRHMGGAIAINLGIMMSADIVIFPILDFAIKKLDWFKFEGSVSKYWVGNYTAQFLSKDVEQSVINLGIIVCLTYLVISTLIGIFDFYRRDVR